MRGWISESASSRSEFATSSCSRAFYEALGWHTRAEPGADVVFFQAGGLVVALWDRASLAHDSGVEDGGGWEV